MSTQSGLAGFGLLGIIVLGVLVGGVFFGTQSDDPATADAVQSFEIGNVSTSHEDGLLRVSAEVTNPMPDARTGTVSLRFDADGDGTFETTSERREVTFAGAERLLVTFEQGTERMSSGQYRYAVFADGEGEGETGEQHHAVTVDIQQPPRFQLSAVPTDTDVVSGDPVTVSFDVTNLGDEARSRLVSFVVDTDGDGSFDTSEALNVTVLELEANGTKTVSLSASTETLPLGTHAYRIQTETDARDGQLTVLQPATFGVEFASVPDNVTRGEPLNATVLLTNTGEVAGTTTFAVGFEDGQQNATENVTLAAGEELVRNVSLATANESRGNTTVVATVADTNDAATVYVKDSQFEVSRLRHDKRSFNGDDLSVEIEARITNTGDVADRQTVWLQLDLDGDDRPERVGLNESLKLGVGDQEWVSFELATEMKSGDSPLKLPVGTYVYGIFTDYEGETDAFAVEGDPDRSSSSGGSDDDDTADDDTEPSRTATLSEITQSKYGIYYEDLSGETIAQVDELYSRQPFAPGYTVTDVLTREEIARQTYGVETPTRHFDFGSLDVELQQQIEADFDAQFTSDDGDRYESWEELAQSMYGTDFDSLTVDQKEVVKERYDEQFE